MDEHGRFEEPPEFPAFERESAQSQVAVVEGLQAREAALEGKVKVDEKEWHAAEPIARSRARRGGDRPTVAQCSAAAPLDARRTLVSLLRWCSRCAHQTRSEDTMHFEHCRRPFGLFDAPCLQARAHEGPCGPPQHEPPVEAGMTAWLHWAGTHLELIDIDRFLHALAPRGPFSLLTVIALRAEHRDACAEALREGRAVRDVALVHWPHLVRRYRVFQNGPWCFAAS